MRLTLIVAMSLLACLTCHLKWKEDFNSEYNFEHFKLEFDRKYNSEDEHKYRELIFNYNLDKIRRINSNPRMTWKAGVNHLTDRTQTEMKEIKGYNRDLGFHLKGFTSIKPSHDFLQNLPEKVDWREKGVVSPVKDQGNCGSCWAFATVSVLESHIALQTGKLLNLSEQQLVDCTPNPHKCGGTGGCEGAVQELGFDYVAKSGGIALQTSYPYKASDQTCNDTVSRAATIDSFVKLPENDYNSLMTALATVGPVSISVAADEWVFYESGVFNGDCGATIDHAVVAVGYGTEDGNDYWIVRNSWSSNWGENGYIRVAREKSAKDVKCEVDKNPASGGGCEGGPSEVTVCGKCGILSDSTYPKGGKLI
jgi:cathepsin L